MNENLESEIDRLGSAPIATLRVHWRSVFKSAPPKAFGPDLLRRSIAHKIQQDAYGGLDAATQRLLNQLIRQAGNASGKILLPRRIKPGSVLVRSWNDRNHQVTVLDNGFAYEGKAYDSLSEIARLITGTRWNGPRFFGLRNEGEQP